MPKSLPARCKWCGKKRADGHYVSRNGNCEECALARITANTVASLKAGSSVGRRNESAARRDRRKTQKTRKTA